MSIWSVWVNLLALLSWLAPNQPLEPLSQIQVTVGWAYIWNSLYCTVWNGFLVVVVRGGKRLYYFIKGIKTKLLRLLPSTYIPLRTFMEPTDVKGKLSSVVSSVSPASAIKLHISVSSSIHFPSKKGFS